MDLQENANMYSAVLKLVGTQAACQTEACAACGASALLKPSLGPFWKPNLSNLKRNSFNGDAQQLPDLHLHAPSDTMLRSPRCRQFAWQGPLLCHLCSEPAFEQGYAPHTTPTPGSTLIHDPTLPADPSCGHPVSVLRGTQAPAPLHLPLLPLPPQVSREALAAEVGFRRRLELPA